MPIADLSPTWVPFEPIKTVFGWSHAQLRALIDERLLVLGTVGSLVVARWDVVDSRVRPLAQPVALGLLNGPDRSDDSAADMLTLTEACAFARTGAAVLKAAIRSGALLGVRETLAPRAAYQIRSSDLSKWLLAREADHGTSYRAIVLRARALHERYQGTSIPKKSRGRRRYE